MKPDSKTAEKKMLTIAQALQGGLIEPMDMDLRNKVSETLKIVVELASESAEGLYILHELAFNSAKALNAIGQAAPDRIRPIARKQILWPISSSQSAITTKTNRAYFDKIHLGKKTALSVDSPGVQKGGTVARKLVVEAVEFIEEIRKYLLAYSSFLSLSDSVSTDWVTSIDFQSPKGWKSDLLSFNNNLFAQKCAVLPALNVASLDSWFELVKIYVNHFCGGDVEGQPEVWALGKTKGQRNAIEGSASQKAHIRSGVFQSLKQALKHLVPKD